MIRLEKFFFPIMFAISVAAASSATAQSLVTVPDSQITVDGTYLIDSTTTLSGTNTVSIASPAINVDLTNRGTVNATNASIFFLTGNGSLTNYGTISSDGYYGVLVSANVSSIINYGTVVKSVTAPFGGGAIGLQNYFGPITVGMLGNYGTISANSINDYALANYSIINQFINYSGGNIQSAQGIALLNDGTINTLDNRGTISSAALGSVYNNGVIGTILNTGVIGGSGVINIGQVNTLSNAQAGLNWNYNLPTTYNVIITNSSTIGKLWVTSAQGTMTFGISSLSNQNVTLTGTYTDVLRGVSSIQLGLGGATSQSGTSNGYSYVLNQAATAGTWDLTVTAQPTPTPTPPPTPPPHQHPHRPQLRRHPPHPADPMRSILYLCLNCSLCPCGMS